MHCFRLNLTYLRLHQTKSLQAYMLQRVQPVLGLILSKYRTQPLSRFSFLEILLLETLALSNYSVYLSEILD